MGILVFYEGDGRIAGDIPGDQWAQMRRLLPLALDLLNIEMRKPHTPPPAAEADTHAVQGGRDAPRRGGEEGGDQRAQRR